MWELYKIFIVAALRHGVSVNNSFEKILLFMTDPRAHSYEGAHDRVQYLHRIKSK